MSGLLQDLRFALRQLRKSPGFTVVAVTTLALGIGMNTAIFSVVDAVLLRSLPYKDPDRLVYFYVGDPKHGGFDGDISVADFLDWKKQNHVFQNIAIFQGAWFTLTGGLEPQRIHGDLIAADWLSTMGVNVSMGRNFRLDEEQQGHNDVVILTNDCWKTRFNRDPNILGKHLKLNGQPFSVVGVLPVGFQFEDRQIFAPFPSAQYAADRQILEMTHAVARLKPEVTLQRAQSEMELIAQQLKKDYPETNKDRGVMLGTIAQDAADLPPTPRRVH